MSREKLLIIGTYMLGHHRGKVSGQHHHSIAAIAFVLFVFAMLAVAVMHFIGLIILIALGIAVTRMALRQNGSK